MAINPAMFADDAIVIYNVIKNKKKSKKEEDKVKTKEKSKEKKAGILSAKTVGLTAGGLLASAYATPEYFGPGENDPRFDPKRALKSVVLWNTIGRSLVDIPQDVMGVAQSARAGNLKELAERAAFTIPGLAATIPVAKALSQGDVPNLETVKNYYLAGSIPVIPYAVRDGYQLSKAIDGLAEKHMPPV